MSEVRSVRINGKVKQEFVRYLGREIDGEAVRRVASSSLVLNGVKRSLDVLAVDRIAEELKLKELIDDRNVLALVYSQLLEKNSISSLTEWLHQTEIPDVLGIEPSTRKFYESLTRLAELPFKDIESALYVRSQECVKENDAAIIDVTDTYFEGKSCKSRPRRGKDGKVRRLLQIGLATTLRHGFPILHETYHGNLSNIHICKDLLITLKQRLNAVIMDRGMLSLQDLKVFLQLKVQVIAGLKKTQSLNKRFLSKIKRKTIFTKQNQVKLQNTSVYIQTYKYCKGQLIAVYNPSLEVLKRELNFEKNIKDNEYIGFSFIYHTTKLSDKEAVQKYYDKDMIEKAFRQLKGVLNLRPIQVWLTQHVKGHVRICYLAYAILAYMNYKLKKADISATQALEKLKYGYKAILQDTQSNHKLELTIPQQPHQQIILKALGVVTKK